MCYATPHVHIRSLHVPLVEPLGAAYIVTCLLLRIKDLVDRYYYASKILSLERVYYYVSKICARAPADLGVPSQIAPHIFPTIPNKKVHKSTTRTHREQARAIEILFSLPYAHPKGRIYSE